MCDSPEALLTKKEEIYFFFPPTACQLLVLKIGTISLKNNVEESEPTHQIAAAVAGSVWVFARFSFTDRKAPDVEKQHTQAPRQASRDRFGAKLQLCWLVQGFAESVGEHGQRQSACTASESYFLILTFIKAHLETTSRV